MKRIIKIAAIILALLVVAFLVFDARMRPRAAAARTQLVLQSAAMACAQFSTYYGHSPASLADLDHNRSNIVFIAWGRSGTNDGWGRPIHYRPFDATTGHGSLVSYGRDGRPGGTGLDADIEAPFQGPAR
jgi:hypothetical protein